MSIEDKWQYAYLHTAMSEFCEKEAFKWYDEVLEDNTQRDTIPYRRSAEIKQTWLFELGKGEKVLEERKRIIDEAKCEVDLRDWVLLIHANMCANQNEQALAVYNKAIQKYPNSWELYFYAGQIYEEMKQYEQAIEYYEKSGVIGTAFCDEKYAIAMCYRKLGKFKEAYQIYLEIADIHRRNGYDVEADQALGYAKEIEDKAKG